MCRVVGCTVRGCMLSYMATEIETSPYYSYQTMTKWEQFMDAIQANLLPRAILNHSYTCNKKNHYLDKHTHIITAIMNYPVLCNNTKVFHAERFFMALWSAFIHECKIHLTWEKISQMFNLYHKWKHNCIGLCLVVIHVWPPQHQADACKSVAVGSHTHDCGMLGRHSQVWFDLKNFFDSCHMVLQSSWSLK